MGEELGAIVKKKKFYKNITDKHQWIIWLVKEKENKRKKKDFYRFYKYLTPKNGKAVWDQLKTNGKTVWDKLKPNVQIQIQCNCEFNSKLYYAWLK